MADEKEDGCVKDQTVDKMQNVVYCISALEIIMSIAFLAYGAMSYLGVDDKKLEVGEYSTNLKLEKNTFLGPLIIVCGLFGFVLGIFGLLAAKFKGCWACPFVIGSLLVAIIALIVGGAIFGGETASQFKEFVCDRAFAGKTGS